MNVYFLNMFRNVAVMNVPSTCCLSSESGLFMDMNTRTKRHKILFIDCGAGRGGSSRFLYSMIKYMDNKLFEPLVAFYFFNDGPDTELMKRLAVPSSFYIRKKRVLNTSL